MRTSTAGSRGFAGGSATRDGVPREAERPDGRRHGRLFRLTASGLATTVVAGMLSVVAVAAAITATPDIAAATTTSVGATWSGSGPTTSWSLT